MSCCHSNVVVMVIVTREKCPGQKECEEAIRVVNSTINMLDQAALAALSQDLKPNASSTQQVEYGCLQVVVIGDVLVGIPGAIGGEYQCCQGDN